MWNCSYVVDRGHEEWLTLLPSDSLKEQTGMRAIGITSAYQTHVQPKRPTVEGSTAEQAGFQDGDQVVAIKANNEQYPIEDFVDINRALMQHVDDELEFTVQRKDPNSPSGHETEHKLTVDPNPVRHLGIVMEPGPILAVRDGSPAKKAGLKTGDKILLVNDEPIGDPLRVSATIRRFAGSEVKLSILRDGEKQDITVMPRVEDVLRR